MHEVVQVQLREFGETKQFITNGIKFESGNIVVVEADRGLDYGEVIGESSKIEMIIKGRDTYGIISPERIYNIFS